MLRQRAMAFFSVSADTAASPLLFTLLGTGFSFLCTVVGASAVFFTTQRTSEKLETLSLGFAAGIMVAASVWSLLLPAEEAAQAAGQTPWLVTTAGFIVGALFLKLLDSLMPHLHMGSSRPEGPSVHLRRSMLLFLAITLHNIPEGGSVGLTAGAAALSGETTALSAALAFALGIGIQNIPEGAAVSLPMRQEGFSKWRAFLFGAASGLVEPLAGLFVVLTFSFFLPAMPMMLAMAAGAMLYVVVEELIPAAHLSKHSDLGTLAFIFGFAVMMALDTALAS